MAHQVTFIILLAVSILATQQATAGRIRQVRQATSTIRSLANLSLDELVYIIQTRNGEVVKKPKQLTPCARAILSCCSEKKMNENCSESLKCGAHFFDDNPCEEKFLTDALKNAQVFYEQFSQRNAIPEKAGWQAS